LTPKLTRIKPKYLTSIAQTVIIKVYVEYGVL
jgi:hypothetical protein